jgi:hypothetical protein
MTSFLLARRCFEAPGRLVRLNLRYQISVAIPGSEILR